SLGRTGEESGRVDLGWRVERGGTVLLHHAERLGLGSPGWGSAVSTGSHRHLVAALSVGLGTASDGPATQVGPDAAAARLQIADAAWMVLAVGADRPAARRAMHAVADLGALRPDIEADRAQIGP
ncbi:MAG: hypothetical protein ABW219_16450, partial [Ilumatobacteraceae bacterium]